ncbi:YggT family protein [Legionella sp. CNM-4043-24]|uniref:YggT family protein n=1 Tax=Legionella sp. CNM-4043-24 TaxID=3421646 RepID=UPI00403B1744
MAGILSVAYFLVTLIFSLVLFVLWLRIALRYFRVSALHPMGHAIYRLTSPLFKTLETRFYAGKRLPQYDWLTLLVIVVIEFIKFLLLGWLVYGTTLPLLYLILFVAADLIVQPCNLLFYALLIRVILSWVNPEWQRHPAADILKLVTNPLLLLGRKIIPDISGFDFGPIIVLAGLKVITLFISASMPLPLV